MLNAEDTKERIRKLRLKVVSGPLDPVVEDNFKENILESTKITTGWNDTAGSANAGQNKIKKNNFIKENVEKALVSLSQKKSKKFQDQNDTKNLNSNMFSQSTIQNEIDNRITNNSKLIIELFNERIEDLKSKIVNTDNFDDFRNRIAEQLEVSITHITEKLNEKIIEIRKQTSRTLLFTINGDGIRVVLIDHELKYLRHIGRLEFRWILQVFLLELARDGITMT